MRKAARAHSLSGRAMTLAAAPTGAAG
jgi:hypothetical protein